MRSQEPVVADDVMQIRSLLDRYCHMIDDADWPALREIFTDDLVNDASDFGGAVRTSLDEFITDISAKQHPVAHHSTNQLVELVGADRAQVRSKTFCVRSDGSTFSFQVEDVAVRTSEGWRISHRTSLLRR